MPSCSSSLGRGRRGARTRARNRPARIPATRAPVARRLRLALIGLATVLGLLPIAPVATASDVPHVSTAFYYGTHPPRELLDHFDRIVLDPDNVPVPPLAARARPFAYVSVGEVHPTRPWRRDVPAAVIVGRDAAWGSDRIDTRAPSWREFLLDHVIEPILARGYGGLFLDTLDTYERITSDPAERAVYAQAVAAIVQAIAARHPDVPLLLNRGFDVLPRLTAPPDGLVVESLFETAGGAGRSYHSVPPSETAALLARIHEARARWNVPVTVIDYVPASDRDLRRRTALRIWNEGFDPYVATPALDGVGVGRVENVPRRVLLLYGGHAVASAPSGGPTAGFLGNEDACVLVAPVLEWLGYAVDYVDVSAGLPGGDLADRYAGVVTWLPEGVDDAGAYRRWIAARLDEGLRVAFLDGFGFEPDGPFLSRLRLAGAGAAPRPPLRITKTSPEVGFEQAAEPRARELAPVRATDGGTTSLLRIEDDAGGVWDGIVLGPWGGAAFAPFVLADGLEQERRWVLDPYRFLRDALALAPIPAPDVTTESGRRILTVHVDGDAFVSRAERPGTPYAGQVILDEILSRYPIPQTVSVIEGEIGPAGLYPDQSPALEAIARRIFRLPWVELGSHTFSHPFEWAKAEAGIDSSPPPALPIPHYRFDRERDLRGSIAYIESRLAPPGKRVRVMQWSGDCAPSAASVAFAQRLGVENVNGGGATRTRDFPSLTRGSSMGIPRGEGVYQVFAPIENENVYTNDWRGPYYGYERAIETFELDGQPRRVRTISIYYHFYSGVKAASLEALRRVYAWALAQETTRLFLSEYAAKVRAFQDVTFARRVDDGAWEVSGLGELRTLRVDPDWGWPDLERSEGIAGVRDVAQGRYVHVARETAAGTDSAILFASAAPPRGPYLESANGRVLRWAASGAGWKVRVAGHEPLSLVIANARECAGRTAHGPFTATARADARVHVDLADADSGEASLACR